MRAFGVAVATSSGRDRGRAAAATAPTEFEIEPDVSTASYFLASAAVTGTTVTLPGLDLDATAQGDIELVAHLERMGCDGDRDGAPLELTGPAAAARRRGRHGQQLRRVHDAGLRGAPFADGPTTITGHRPRPRQGVRPHRRAPPRTCGGWGSRSTRARDYLRVHPGTPQRGAAADLRGPPHRDGVLADRHTRRRSSSRSPASSAKTCPTFFELWRRTGAGGRGAALMVSRSTAPPGPGKSTVARAVAERLGFTYLDTGAMYRCVALAALRRDVPAGISVALADRRSRLGERVLLDGEDVTDADPHARGLRGRLAGGGRPGGARGDGRPAAAAARPTATGSRRDATSAPSSRPRPRSRCSSPPRPASARAAAPRSSGPTMATVLAEQTIRDAP